MKRSARYNDQHKIELTDGINQPLRRGDRLVFPDGQEFEVVSPPHTGDGFVELPDAVHVEPPMPMHRNG